MYIFSRSYYYLN